MKLQILRDIFGNFQKIAIVLANRGGMGWGVLDAPSKLPSIAYVSTVQLTIFDIKYKYRKNSTHCIQLY